MNKIKSLVHCIHLESDYESIPQIPKNKIGFTLNIMKYTTSGKMNLYHKHKFRSCYQPL